MKPCLTMSMKAISAQMVSLANIPLHGRQEVSAHPLSGVTIQMLLCCISTARPEAVCTQKYRPSCVANGKWLHLHRLDFAC